MYRWLLLVSVDVVRGLLRFSHFPINNILDAKYDKSYSDWTFRIFKNIFLDVNYDANRAILNRVYKAHIWIKRCPPTGWNIYFQYFRPKIMWPQMWWIPEWEMFTLNLQALVLSALEPILAMLRPKCPSAPLSAKKTSTLAWIWIFMNIFQYLFCSEIQSSSFEYVSTEVEECTQKRFYKMLEFGMKMLYNVWKTNLNKYQ